MQRTASTYIFGAVCPHEGKGAALILPACNTEAIWGSVSRMSLGCGDQLRSKEFFFWTGR